MNRTDYIISAAEKFGVIDSKNYATPMEENLKLMPSDNTDTSINYRNLIGTLLYITNGTRADVSFSVNFLSRFQNACSPIHYKYALRILQYLYHTRDLRLEFNGNGDVKLDAYVDSDFASDLVDRKSTSGILIRINDTPILWKSQTQKVVSIATSHAEYYALSECVTELLPIKGLLTELGIDFDHPVPIFEDNKGAFELARNSIFHKNSKHIDVR